MPRAVIADHPAVRMMPRQIIEGCASVVFEAGDGLDALEAIGSAQPDLLILDVSMPKMGGFEVLRALRNRSYALVVIMVSECRDPAYVRESRSLGASDFLLKGNAARELPECIHRLFPPAP
jgi:DNA-binding NarL/FixJ family response regulator